ncbi:MAG: ABC transporter permease [Anaerolineae bacterium]
MASDPLRVLAVTAGLHLRLLLRQSGARLGDILMPSAVALAPILLGRVVGGTEAGAAFAGQVGSPDFAGFLLIGGGAFFLVTRSLWGLGSWLRDEAGRGTLESLYLTPAAKSAVLAGVALAFSGYSALMFVLAVALGNLLFQATLGGGNLLLALAFLLVGLPPLYGLSLLYGALVLRLKEADAFLQLAQWIATLLMGVYFPVSLLPAFLRLLAWLFPPAWLTQGVRGALLGLPFLSGAWPADLAVLAGYCLLAPLLGYLVFARAERSLRAGAGIGGV